MARVAVARWSEALTDSACHLRAKTRTLEGGGGATWSIGGARSTTWRAWWKSVLKRHPWSHSVDASQPSRLVSRTQHILVQGTALLAMLFVVLRMFSKRDVECCIDYKEYLGCGPANAVDSECHGYTTCGDLYDAHESGVLAEAQSLPSFDCDAFPRDQLRDHILVLAIALAVMQLLSAMLTLLYTIGGAPRVPQHLVRRRPRPFYIGLACACCGVQDALNALMHETEEIWDTRRVAQALKPLFRPFRWAVQRVHAAVWQTSAAQVVNARLLGQPRDVDRLSLQCAHLLSTATCVTIILIESTYGVAERDKLAIDVPHALWTSWGLIVIVNYLLLPLMIGIVTVFIVDRVKRAQETSKGRKGCMAWYESYISKNLNASYSVA
ncbi:hypothetical protein CYMTET_12011 [Cymbomonas tetramitiformis]|uniref:Uncharacterized protein n=1 Tax=Cymbomonas tetramitiformis TaxID=36881 RepID=A0AAE0GKY7_9CHLO|nr:hypothetical protein CYMTET_12011 [Cymbomonas tetramitiformis]